LQDDLWSVEVDEAQIGQVISNIVINADQAMSEGGLVKLRADNISLRSDDALPLKEGTYIRLSISDQGSGISEANLQRIFDPFFTTKQEGSGLGLATSYSIVQGHNGHMTVESQLGVGTIFHIYLPAFPGRAITKSKSEEGKPAMGNGNILVMDDEKHVRDMAAEMLNSLGYKATTAVDGIEAIEMYRDAMLSDSRFDAAIIDLTVPGSMGGKETIQKLIEIDPEVKAIVSSGYSNDPIMANFREHGFEGFIAKPYKIREFSEVLQEVLKRA
jgi:CheY-like chemotaxis protein